MKKHLPDDLFSFALVVDKGSFTKAAKSLGVSVSVLSKRVQRLESSLGVHLLQRTTREFRLTEMGKECYEEIKQLKTGFEEIIQKLKSRQVSPKGKLRVSAPASFSQVLAPYVFEFMQHYPECEIEILLGQPSVRLLEKNIDIGIFIKEIPDSNLIAKKIGMRKIIVCASPDYLQKHGTPQTPLDLIHHCCLLYRAEKLKNEWRFQKTVVKVKGNFSANSSQMLMNAALAGKGIIKVPSFLVQDALKEKKLISVLDAHCPKDIGIYAAYSFTRHPSANVKVFIEFLVKRFKENGK